ncbi:hypothetical protein CRI94_10185 [Longibacter salinarum]|uniref:Uncharacterized protein n=1 Tax=Longibacter salinarum TaxID=1850348 RepID=A0A2A8CWE0_9BACT|nr:hypothetical protein [Longibacter salinarum]PEN13015.1 hypothetical protein CRI94_10185 [Longibacter salinarum]
MIPESAAEIQNQLAFISAVLGGFSISLAIGWLQMGAESEIMKRTVTWAAGAAVTAALSLLVATVAGAWGVIWLAERPDMGRQAQMPGPLLTAFRLSGQAFLLGISALLVSLGISGWTRSRALGWATSAGAGLAAIILTYFLIGVMGI